MGKTDIFWYNRAMNFSPQNYWKTFLISPTTGEKTWIREIIEFALLVVLIVIPFRVFVAEPYIVSGVSMSQTFETGHYLIINKFWHKIKDVERGDVLVFQSPVENEKYYIKRVVGLPGETVSIANTQVTITTPDGTELVLDEPYIKNKTYATVSIDLGPTEYFMMGDNRAQSFDSRAWGPMDASYIRGEPVVRLYPFTNISLMPGRDRTSTETMSE